MKKALAVFALLFAPLLAAAQQQPVQFLNLPVNDGGYTNGNCRVITSVNGITLPPRYSTRPDTGYDVCFQASFFDSSCSTASCFSIALPPFADQTDSGLIQGCPFQRGAYALVSGDGTIGSIWRQDDVAGNQVPGFDQYACFGWGGPVHQYFQTARVRVCTGGRGGHCVFVTQYNPVSFDPGDGLGPRGGDGLLTYVGDTTPASNEGELIQYHAIPLY